MIQDGIVTVHHEALRRQVAALFHALGVPEGDADVAADVLVQADLRGVESHGVSNYINLIYVPGLKAGNINPHPRIHVEHARHATAVINGDGGLGMVVGHFAMSEAIHLARDAGAAWVTARNSRHFGMAGYYAMMALEHDMIGFSFTNAGPLQVPTYGRQPMLGTNPIAFAAPAGEEWPFVLDMATSTVAIGKVIGAMRTGGLIPLGWAVDSEGRPTSDAGAAVQARALMPLGGAAETGGYKGYGLATMVDILSGVLSGAGFSAALAGGEVGHCFGAICIDAFRPAAEFKSTMDEAIRALRNSAKAEGAERIYVAGEKEFETERERRTNGIPLHPEVVETLRRLSDEAKAPWTLT
ncbi:MAG TPA: Ldh family oxidoreductase [Dehalococcoidia bacterium]|nr:Ldh family oxidoreductase [Dehalococcoidia bacterium]